MLTGLGYEYLSLLEQKAYMVILKAFSLMFVSLDCSQIASGVDLMKVIQVVLGDNPSITYFNKTQINIEESALEKRIILSGIHLKPQAKKMSMALDVTANLITSSLKATSSNEYSLLINTYEFLQKSVLYDYDELQANIKGICRTPASHNAYGALINKKAVCDGFSSAFNLLVQKLGFKCMLVIGKSTYTSTNTVNHAWNIIKVRDNYYHMDITWDARKYVEFNETSYAYFGLSDDDVQADHEWDKKATPRCLYNDFSYYKKTDYSQMMQSN